MVGIFVVVRGRAIYLLRFLPRRKLGEPITSYSSPFISSGYSLVKLSLVYGSSLGTEIDNSCFIYDGISCCFFCCYSCYAKIILGW